MGTRKKGSELVFNLQWKNKVDNGGDKSNVIGMYDTPTTTSNFEMFKSYLLKNSGVAGNDVKVTYLTDNGQEWVIDSQESFELALSAFRLKARLGEVIFLKLDKISNGKHKMLRKHSNDVETQSDVDSMGNNVVVPPEWFITYMKQFKRDIVDEVTYAVSSNLAANSKEKENIPIVITSSKKIKPEASKRSRKHLVLGETPIDKELLKTLKFDRKLENKLDKLDAKTKKIKEKKQALIYKIENDEHRYFGSKPLSIHVSDKGKTAPATVPKKETLQSKITVDANGTPLFNGCAVNSRTYQHMMGGEVYLHTWYITNNGKQKWSSKTELRLTWGSAELVPSVKSIRCPCLKPGEQGSISVNFEIPKRPGTYESYWNFYHENVRFGNSLSCYIIVEEPLTATVSPISTYPQPKFYENTEPLSECLKPLLQKDLQGFCKEKKIDENRKPLDTAEITLDSATAASVDPYNNSVNFLNLSQTKDDFKPLENSSPSRSENIKTEEENALQKILLYPDGIKDTSRAISITVPRNAEKVIWYPQGTNQELLEPIEIPLKLFRGSETKSSPQSSLTNSVEPFQFVPADEGAERNPDGTNKSYSLYPHLSWPKEKPNDLNDGSMYTGLPNHDQSKQIINENDCCMLPKEDMVLDENMVSSQTVMDLRKGIEDIKLGQDSDSDWGSVCSFEKEMPVEANFTTNFADSTTNKYGILEKDLIVDLSTGGRDAVAEKTEGKEEKLDVVTNEDNNNNNGAMENNNCARGSISEAESEASSVSSGYDVLQVPVCDEKEDSSGYVYITIDGNKLPVPKHILRPDFLANAEEAPGPIPTDDERPVEKLTDSKENVTQQTSATGKTESQISDTKQEVRDHTIEEKKPSVTNESETGASFPSDLSNGRLFIFPQNQPGYEVFRNDDSADSTLNREDSFESYTWSKSPTHYNLYDPPHMEGIDLMQLKRDLYGPFNNSSPFTENQSTPPPDQPAHRTCPFASYGGSHYYQRSRPSTQFTHVPNYQQSGFSRYAEQHPGPSAPPQPQQQQEPPKTPEQAQAANAPVHHILPENLVTGAVNVASSAINTARSVINMLASPKPEAGRWVNGHWVTENTDSLRAKNLVILAEMGFWDTDLNATLLARYNDDISRVITELVQ